MFFVITLCSACTTEDEIAEREADIKETSYEEGYEDAKADYDVYEGTYEDGYREGRKDAADKAYDYLYKKYGIDDDSIIDYCNEP